MLLEHCLGSPDLAPVDYFLFRRLKEELAGIRFTLESRRPKWVIGHIAVEKLAIEFMQQFDRCNNCIRINKG
jgi:hypothetical protein